MLKNSVYYKCLISFFALLFLLTCLNAESQATTLEEFNLAYNVLNNVEAEIGRKMTTLSQYYTLQQVLLAKLEDNDEDRRDNVFDALGGPQSGIAALGKGLSDSMDGVQLQNSLNGVNASIVEFINDEIDEGIFQRQGNASGVVVGYNQAYDNYTADYSGLTEADRGKVNQRLFATSSTGHIYKTKLEVPDANTVFVQPCNNPSNTPSGKCWGYYEDPDKHLSLCMYNHGISGETNIDKWTCHSDACSRSSEHWVPCRGNGCNVLFPPPTVTNYFSSESSGITTVTEYHDHEVVCQYLLYSIWNGMLGYQKKCGQKYFTCEGACQHSSNSGGGSNNQNNNNGGENGSGSTSTDTTTYDNTACTYCTDGCSSCQTSTTDSDDDDDDSGTTTVMCRSCNQEYDSSDSTAVERHQLKSCYTCWLYYADCTNYSGRCTNGEACYGY